MAQRLQLHQILKTFVDHVYFQPPENIQLQYPCIVYHRDAARTQFADDKPYSFTQRYMLTIIDPNPDGVIREKVASLPKCLYDRFYAVDDLNHDVFSVYF